MPDIIMRIARGNNILFQLGIISFISSQNKQTNKVKIFERLKNSSFSKCLALLLIIFVNGHINGQTTRPNIVVILTDDLGIGSVGAYGAPTNLVQTPAIDGLANEGRKYMNAFAPASLCSPSRYGVLTGKYYWRDVREYGIIEVSDPCVIPQDKNLAARLNNEGYNTAYIGKWHLGYNNPGIIGGPETVGFDFNYDYRTGINTDNESRTAEFLDRETSNWIDAQSNVDPFFLYFVPIAVHTPIIPGVEYQGSSGAGAYGDFINEVDGSVQNILAALDRNGFTDNTIVIFTSDNGAASSAAINNGAGDLKVNGDYRGTKLTIFDAGFRVPLIIKWPNNIPVNTISNKDVNLVDIYASIMEMLNIDMLSPAEEAGDSFSFYQAWFDDANQPDRENMILASYEGINAIYTNGWKFIDGIPREPEPYDFFNPLRIEREAHEQLYDIGNDPYETNDLVNIETAKASELKTLLNDIRAQGYSRANNSLGSGELHNLNDEITVYPNPTNGLLNLSSREDWTLFDITGKVIMFGISKEIDLRHLSVSMYFLKTSYGMKKIIKN